jgi:hypothetical protein
MAGLSGASLPLLWISAAPSTVFDNMLALLYNVLDDASSFASFTFHHLSQVIITTMIPHILPRSTRRAVLLLKFMYDSKRKAE